MAFNDIFRLRLYQRLHGAQVVNVLHFVQIDPLPTTGAQWLADDFKNNLLTPLRVRSSNQLFFESVEVQSLVPFSGSPAVSTYPAGTAGAVTEQCISATLAEVITIYSERAGRRGRGRIYLAGGPLASGSIVNSQGVWNANQTASTISLATAIATRYMGGTLSFHLGVWSKLLAGTDPPWPTSAFARATGLTVRTIMRTQRRRQVGVGR